MRAADFEVLGGEELGVELGRKRSEDILPLVTELNQKQK
jgi:hypothetical protein